MVDIGAAVNQVLTEQNCHRSVWTTAVKQKVIDRLHRAHVNYINQKRASQQLKLRRKNTESEDEMNGQLQLLTVISFRGQKGTGTEPEKYTEKHTDRDEKSQLLNKWGWRRAVTAKAVTHRMLFISADAVPVKTRFSKIQLISSWWENQSHPLTFSGEQAGYQRTMTNRALHFLLISDPNPLNLRKEIHPGAKLSFSFHRPNLNY